MTGHQQGFSYYIRPRPDPFPTELREKGAAGPLAVVPLPMIPGREVAGRARHRQNRPASVSAAG
jgi:hypothetical protein